MLTLQLVLWAWTDSLELQSQKGTGLSKLALDLSGSHRVNHADVWHKRRSTRGVHSVPSPTPAAKARFSRQSLPGNHTNNFFLRKKDLRPFQATVIRVPHLPKLKVLLISLNMTLIARAWEMTHLTNNAPLWISKPTVLAVLKKMIKIAWMP